LRLESHLRASASAASSLHAPGRNRGGVGWAMRPLFYGPYGMNHIRWCQANFGGFSCCRLSVPFFLGRGAVFGVLDHDQLT